MKAKRLVAPTWATKDKVIGYTFREALNPHVLENFELFFGECPLDGYPSVYYENGHATLDHQSGDNIGWDGSRAWQCLFFGNVDAEWSQNRRPHGPDRNAKGAAYAADLGGKFKNYCSNSSWTMQVEPEFPVPWVLVEVWRTGPNDILIHASRNRFRWAYKDTRELLHKLATTQSIMSDDRQYAKHLAQAPKVKQYPSVPQPPRVAPVRRPI